MSKGSRQRPVDRSRFDENWDRIFGKKKKPTEGVDRPEKKDDTGPIK